MKNFATLVFLLLITWASSQAQTPLFKFRPEKKKSEKSIKKGTKKTVKKGNLKITDRYRKRINRRKKTKRTPKNKARLRKRACSSLPK